MQSGMTADGKPGQILKLWLELRKHVGTVKAKKKDGVKFKVRSAEDLIDQVRGKANELGILIYPHWANGKGHVVEDGTLADVTLTVIAQAIEDGSQLSFAGFGLGADHQDKAGGKAGTYAFKQALIQALLAGGSDSAKQLGVADTDDSDTPIMGGVKPKSKTTSVEVMRKKLESVGERDTAGYSEAIKELMILKPADQLSLKDAVISAKARSIVAP